MNFEKCNTRTNFRNFERHIVFTRVFTWQNWATLPFFALTLCHLSATCVGFEQQLTYTVTFGCPYTPFPVFSTPAVLVPRFPVSRFPPLQSGAAFSSLAFSNLAFSTVPPFPVSRFQSPRFVVCVWFFEDTPNKSKKTEVFNQLRKHSCC